MSTTFGTKQISADQHASLTAPARDRSITVDDFIEQPVHADPESDSDADENEPTVLPTHKRRRSAIRRSNSSLSFESDAQEDEDVEPPNKKQRSGQQDPTHFPTPSASESRPSHTISLPAVSPVPGSQHKRGYSTDRSSLSPKRSSTKPLFEFSQVRSPGNTLSQPETSPIIAQPLPHHSVSSYVYPKSRNAPRLSIDPSGTLPTTPPHPTHSHPLPDPKIPVSNPDSLKLRDWFSNSPSVKHSSPTLPIPTSPHRPASPTAFSPKSSTPKPISPKVNITPLSPKLAARKVSNSVSSDPEPRSPSPKISASLAARYPQPQPANSKAAVLQISSPVTSNRPPPRGQPISKPCANSLPTTAQPRNPSISPSAQEPNSSMEAPTPTVLLPAGSAQASHDVRRTTDQAQLPPLTHDDLVNIRIPTPADGGDWDRFVFFKHRPRRHDFGNSCYLSDYSPFAALAPAVANEPPSTICAVCGGGYNLIPCNGCVCAFHEKCVAPFPVTGSPWYCNGCRSAGIPDNNPTQIPEPPSNISLAAQALHRPIIDAKEGNPIDLVLHPSLMALFRNDYGGYDWLQCYSCRRRRIVPNGILCESVEIPFECEGMFWLPEKERNCVSQMDRDTQAVEKHINEQAARRGERRKALLEMFGNGSDDGEEDSLRSDPANVKLSAKPKVREPQQPNIKAPKPPLIPNGTPVSDAVPDSASSSQFNTDRVIDQNQTVNDTRPSPQSSKANGFAPMEVDTVIAEQPHHPNAELTPTVSAVTNVTPRLPAPPSQQTMPMPATASTADKTKLQMTKQEDSTVGPGTRPEDVQQDLLVYIADLELDEPTEDILTDLALTNNKALTRIYIAFRSNKDRFKRQAVRIAKREAKTS
ncbi:unnamed protein product [Agarophyton chilense]|eukprot:gb/GEZJ01001702.1/.p1 GENE.gb/GEZJ01001702.1/~~gb/GEZJ01001702.1/.p1  ORF type:complete len:870 (-),score=95.91 gb/GEZJ01001702.1/:411-3020(-)